MSGREVFQIRNIERYTNTRIQRGKAPTVDEVYEARANVFLDKLRATLKSGEYKRHDHLIERLLEEGFASTDIASALIHHLQGGDAAPAKVAPPPFLKTENKTAERRSPARRVPTLLPQPRPMTLKVGRVTPCAPSSPHHPAARTASGSETTARRE